MLFLLWLEGLIAAIEKSILLVEDDVITAFKEIKQLQNYGYNIVHADSGEAALELVHNPENLIDLILMDIDLGEGIDGTQAAEEILQDREVPIVFLSSHTSHDIVERTEKITSYGYVVKDTGIVVLDASIKMAFKLFNTKSALDSSKNHLSNAVAMANLGYWEMDTKNLIFTFSDSLFDIYHTSAVENGGHQITLDEYLGGFVHPDDVGWSLKQIRNLMRNDNEGFTLYFEHRIKYVDGGIGYLAVRLFVVRDKKGNVTKGYGINQDITDRVLFEQSQAKEIHKKEVLLQIVYNRIRNSVNSIKTFLKLKAESISNDEAKDIIYESINGIEQTQNLHQKLMEKEERKDCSTRKYLENMLDAFLNILPKQDNVDIEMDIEDFIMNTDKIFLLGVIINEYVTSIIKCSLKLKNFCRLNLKLSKIDDMVKLIVTDNVSKKEMKEKNSPDYFDEEMVRTLSELLDGKFEKDENDYNKSTIVFKLA